MSARKTIDPYHREVRSFLDGVRNMTPGLSSTLPPALDMWGRPRTYSSELGPVYDFVSPAKVSPIGSEPANQEMLRLGWAPQKPSKTVNVPGFGDANLRNYPSIYNEIVQRAGEPALKELNDLVNGNGENSDFYNSLKDSSSPTEQGSKARYLAGRLDYYRKQATSSVLRDFPDQLQAIAADQARRRTDARGGQ